MRNGTGSRLDPVRLRPPRPRSLLRYAVIAALLVLAAGVLFLEPPGAADGADCARGARRTAARPTPGGTPSARRDTVLPVPSGYVGVPVQLAEPATAAVLRPGVRVDVIARTGRGSPGSPSPSGTAGGGADRDVVVARDLLVLAVDADGAGSPHEGVLYLAVPAEDAERVATIPPETAVGVTVRPG